MPDPVQTETPVQTPQTDIASQSIDTSATPTQVQQPEANLSPREALYQKYANLYPDQQAQSEQTTQTQTSATPPQTPVVQTPPAVPEEITSTIQALQAEIASLKSQIPSKPADPPTPTVEPTWIDKLREGDFEGAERIMTERIKAATANDVIKAAANEAIESIRVRNEIDNYVKELRAQNPEIVPMERYLLAPVQARLETARAKGLMATSDDFIREYKAAVDAEVNEIRKISQQYRAAGKNEAMTTKREVLSASTLNPQQVSQDRGNPETDQTPDVSPESYFAQRAALSARQRGLSA